MASPWRVHPTTTHEPLDTSPSLVQSSTTIKRLSRSGVLLRWQCLISWIILIVSFPGIFLVANRVTESNLTEEDVADKEGVDFDSSTFGHVRHTTEDVVDEAAVSHHGNPSAPETNNHD
ncbi:hypothetical protein O0I10_011795 [Lichtheimia ornata]|uniref:Uncharacterized protein n=1 Tax=Lichtheimia ornata TaxID=688661 RepID=A0AAD7XTR3_9FUNG|nr:uncharacterized protein O0I10_011795 [Lichtheimia ornata]KAJ8652536.1 hypothetical protein O0I10_011795 [Lichtheimia ornata]